MTVHLLKPALRISDVFAFAERQKQWHMEYAPSESGMAFPVWTSRKPARIDEMLDGGSVFWIVKKAIQVRQAIIGFENYEGNAKGDKPSYLIMCDTQLIRTHPISKNPFQGWRYLEGANAPKDIAPIRDEDERPPAEMEKELREAGLI